MRLIDADELKIDYGFSWDDITPTHEEMIAVIERQPTIDAVPRQKYEEDMENAFAHGYTDAESDFRKMIEGGELVGVVRCKDCEECEIDEVFHDYWCNGRKVWKDHYCAYGERKNDECDTIRCKSCVWYTKIDRNTGVCVWRLEPKTKNSCCPEWMPKKRRTDGTNDE